MASFDRSGESAGAQADVRRGRQRLDKWLWFARVARTRSAAAQLVAEGHVRVNGRRIALPAKPIARGDVLTIALERQMRVLKVVAIGRRRGPYQQARALFEDLVAETRRAAPTKPAEGIEEAPGGRAEVPTKLSE